MEELKVSELKALLREQGLKVSGKKKELIARLEGKEEEKPVQKPALKTVKEPKEKKEEKPVQKPGLKTVKEPKEKKEEKEEEKPVQKPALKTMEEQKKIEERKIIKTFLPFPEIPYNPLTIFELKTLLGNRNQSQAGRTNKTLIKRLVEKDKSDLLKRRNMGYFLLIPLD